MVLLDTHVWIYYYTNQLNQLSKTALSVLDQDSELLISPISGWELAQLVKKKRLGLNTEVMHWIYLTQKDTRLSVLDLSLEILVESVLLKELHKDPADRILASTSIIHNIPLVTADKKLQQFSKLKTIW